MDKYTENSKTSIDYSSPLNPIADNNVLLDKYDIGDIVPENKSSSKNDVEEKICSICTVPTIKGDCSGCGFGLYGNLFDITVKRRY